jgi:hypothetical protein
MFFSSLLQGVPRTIALDSNTGVNLIQLPIEEIDSLRGSKVSQTDVKLDAGAVMEVKRCCRRSGEEKRKRSSDCSKDFLKFSSFFCFGSSVDGVWK